MQTLKGSVTLAFICSAVYLFVYAVGLVMSA